MKERKRRILFLIPSLQGGGAERVIVNLLRYLDRSRFSLMLAVVDMRNAVFQPDLPDDVELIDLGGSRVRYALPKIGHLIWNRRPEVVFSTLGHLNLALAIIRPLLPNGTRYIARETSIVSATLSGYARSPWWGWAYRKFYHRFNAVVCQSQYMRNDLVHNFSFPKEKAIVIHNPVDVDRVRRLANESVLAEKTHQFGLDSRSVISLVSVGRLVSVKGFDILIEAMALCEDSRLRLTVLGEGPLLEKLESLSLAKGVAPQVRFVGFQKNPFPFIAHADAFVLSSRFEGFPNVVLEALTCGTPVIATPAPGGLKEILKDIRGCEIADAVSSDALAEAIRRWIAKGKRRLVDESSIVPYSIERIVRQYEESVLS